MIEFKPKVFLLIGLIASVFFLTSCSAKGEAASRAFNNGQLGYGHHMKMSCIILVNLMLKLDGMEKFLIAVIEILFLDLHYYQAKAFISCLVNLQMEESV